jgi:hypothetical protein
MGDIAEWEFLNYLNDYQLPNKDFAALNSI